MPRSVLVSIATSGPSSSRTSQRPDCTQAMLSCSPSGTVTCSTGPSWNSTPQLRCPHQLRQRRPVALDDRQAGHLDRRGRRTTRRPPPGSWAGPRPRDRGRRSAARRGRRRDARAAAAARPTPASARVCSAQAVSRFSESASSSGSMPATPRAPARSASRGGSVNSSESVPRSASTGSSRNASWSPPSMRSSTRPTKRLGQPSSSGVPPGPGRHAQRSNLSISSPVSPPNSSTRSSASSGTKCTAEQLRLGSATR